MLGQLSTDPLGLLFWAIGIIIAITVHEFAHAYAAERLGDPTPRLMGRLTLNPLAHLDPMGTIMLVIARFGWGKPVQFDPFNLRNPRRDSAIISIAGPIANGITALIAALLLHLVLQFGTTLGIAFVILFSLLHAIVVYNVLLGVFNLVPVHPLDGFKIVGGMLSEEQARSWHQLERYGMLFLIILILPFGGVSPISRLISPIIDSLLAVLLP